MTIQIKIKRQDNCSNKSYYQTFSYSGDVNDSVATILRVLNERDVLCDTLGNPAKRIVWECGCMQKRCGACAMLINGVPRLACSVFAGDLACKDNTILLEPLGKFTVVADLAVDKSAIFESLHHMKLWLHDESHLTGWSHAEQFESGRCLMCGCCLEVCPNYLPGEDFSGAIGAVNAYRFLEQSRHDEHRSEMLNAYRKLYYKGCSKSLSCHSICPIKLPVEELLVRSNAVAVWKK